MNFKQELAMRNESSAYIQKAIDKQRPKADGKHCLWCGKKLVGRQRTFCDDSNCNIQIFNKYNWAKIRERIIERDGHQCKAVGCAITHGLSVHHIIKVIERPDLVMSDSNLITLCREHHEQAEAMFDKPSKATEERVKMVSLGFIFEIPVNHQLDKFILLEVQKP